MRTTIKQLREKQGFPIFGSTDIFDIVWKKLKETSLSSEERHVKMNELFTGIIKGGVTDVFMMKGWELRDGCQVERKAAKDTELNIQEL